jgi:hypothetical protein
MSFVLPIQKNPQREIADFVTQTNYPSIESLVPSTGEIVPSFEPARETSG